MSRTSHRQANGAILLSLTLLLSPLAAQELASVDNKPSRETIRFWDSVDNVWLTAEQTQLLDLAYTIGKAEGGREHALLLQAILMHETRAGQGHRVGDTHSPVGKRSYGIMQVKLVTAYDTLKRHRNLGEFKTEEDLIIRLVTDDNFNLHVASHHLSWLRRHTNFTAQAVMAYNTGLSKAQNHWYPQKFQYVRKIQRYLDEVVIPYNRRRGLATTRLVLVE